MRLRAFLALGLLAMVSVTPAIARGPGSWPMSGHDGQNSNDNATERIIGPRTVSSLHQNWFYQVRNAYQVIATGSRVYALAPQGRSAVAVILDARTGKPLHILTPAALHLALDDIPSALAYVHGRLIIGASLHSVVALNAVTGTFLWRAPVAASYLSVAGTTLYTGNACTGGPRVCGTPASVAIDSRTGRILWRHPGNGGNQPVLIAGRLFQRWGFAHGNTRVYDPRTGSLIATLPLDATWMGNRGSACAMVGMLGQAQPGWVGCIGPTGKPAWKDTLGHLGLRTGPPAFARGAIITPSNRFHPGIITVGAARGRLLWASDVGLTYSLIVANGLVFALRSDGGLTVLDQATGRVVDRLPKPPARVEGTTSIYSQLIANGTLFEVGENGIVALRP